MRLLEAEPEQSALLLEWLAPATALGRRPVPEIQGIVTDLLLHGDSHPWNVLASGEGWRAIDPNPVAGKRAFDAAWLLASAPVDIVGTGFLHLIDASRARGRPLRGWALARAADGGLWDLRFGSGNAGQLDLRLRTLAELRVTL